ncbi:hypothetical protein ES332_A12G190300v1 [Gossypium tomentosum]|uniref:Secreted protein n=1 Tax=Gossypium tomentosum TaxID=34277 RepID=A0A5D2MZD6_GOSTO|nr:hypothetical protein ES332_A12G190300v1 [Gossypium tomentosum]
MSAQLFLFFKWRRTAHFFLLHHLLRFSYGRINAGCCNDGSLWLEGLPFFSKLGNFFFCAAFR